MVVAVVVVAVVVDVIFVVVDPRNQRMAGDSVITRLVYAYLRTQTNDRTPFTSTVFRARED